MKLIYFTLVLTFIQLIGNGECIIKDLAEIFTQTKPGDVKLYLYTRSNLGVPLSEVTLDNTTAFYERFNAQIQTVFTVHGWFSGRDSEFSVTLRDAFLTNYDVNFVEVVWPAKNDYVSSCAAMVHYGEYLGDFIKALCLQFTYSYDNVKLIGDGLGAHFCGATGRVTNGQCKFIVGTDPDGTFLYDWEYDDSRQLADHHAQHVQVIHTSAGNHGLKKSAGTSDFWPNKGSNQPGCTSTLDDCSHDKAHQYYAESLSNTTNGFNAVGYDNDLDTIDAVRRAFMGGFDLDPNAKGDYFLKTNAAEPYALGDAGI